VIFTSGDVRAGEMRSSSYSSILLPLLQYDTVSPLVKMVCSLLARRGTLILVSVVEVPSEMSMDTARELGNRADLLMAASRCAKRCGVDPAAYTIKARSAGEAIVETAAAEGADLVVVGFCEDGTGVAHQYRGIAHRIRKNAPCDVLTVNFGKARYARRVEVL
jgi:nucleotide-binding universal stress UspA family protein